MPASRGSEEGCRPGLRASPPRLLKLRSQGSGPWFVFVHHQIRKVRGFCARQGVEVLHWAPGPHRPVPQALLQGDSRGQTPGLCLGVRAVYAGLCLRGGSSWLPLLPGPTHPRAGDSGDPELRALHSPHHSRASEAQDRGLQDPDGCHFSQAGETSAWFRLRSRASSLGQRRPLL